MSGSTPVRSFARASLIALLLPACGGSDATPAPVAMGSPEDFVDESACGECHAKELAAWTGSHHDRAMEEASEASVVGDFGDAVFEHRGETTRFFRRDGKYFVNTAGADGQPADFEVRYTFGVDPLQQYLIEFPGGRYQALTIAWDTAGKRWFHLHPDDDVPHDDPFDWTGRYQSWNAMCAECHSTNLVKGYDAESDAYDTTWDKIDVGCQACHGPGDAHVRWARGGGDAAADAAAGLAVDLKSGGPHAEIDACARCHARRHRVSATYEHGRPFLDDFAPELLREGMYHADGQILEEVYEYGSFLQSRMYRAGVRCSDCHEPHGLGLKGAGNSVCTQCHTASPPLARFPTLKAKSYDGPEHHFHAAGSAGAQCVACHMPERAYMVVDPRRDHGLRIPRPDLSVDIGTPNACNACHADRDAAWAAEAVVRWYGEKEEAKPHFARAIAAGRAGRPSAEPALIAVAADREESPIVRASALDLLGGFGPAGLAATVAATKDDEPLVRLAAVGALERLPPTYQVPIVAPRLDDPIRAVRVEAARVLATAPAEMLDPAQRAKLDAALAELDLAQREDADVPAGRMALAVLADRRGKRDRAEELYRDALAMDALFLPARFNLAGLYNRLGRNSDAERVLREGIELLPDEGELHYSLGLVLAELGRSEECVAALGRAAELLPDRSRVHYNHGLALRDLGRIAEAEVALRRAHELAPADADALHALALLLLGEGQPERALPYADELLRLAPEASFAHELMEQVQRELESRLGPR